VEPRLGLVELGLVSLVGYVDPLQWTLWCDRCPVFEVLSLLRYLEAFCIVIIIAFWESTP
jgi:hypothetical protein